MPERDQSGRTYHVLGVPLRTGSLYPGNENDAQAFRDARLLTRLREAGCRAVDEATSRFRAISLTTRSRRSGAGRARGSLGTA